MKNYLKTVIYCILFLPLPLMAQSMDRTGSLGLGFSNQLQNNMEAISFKIQKSRAFSFGGVLGFNSDDNGGGFGAGIKLYRIFFDEPQLTFYGSLLGAFTKQKVLGADSESGFQFDITLGSEFSLTGLKSIGLSFEFGISLNKVNDFVIETVSDNFFIGSVHFYI